MSEEEIPFKVFILRMIPAVLLIIGLNILNQELGANIGYYFPTNINGWDSEEIMHKHYILATGSFSVLMFAILIPWALTKILKKDFKRRIPSGNIWRPIIGICVFLPIYVLMVISFYLIIPKFVQLEELDRIIDNVYKIMFYFIMAFLCLMIFLGLKQTQEMK